MTDTALPRPHSDRIARLVLDSATDFAIVSLDLHGKVTSWNPGAEQVLGWTEAEMVGRDACVFFTEEDTAEGVCDREMAVAAREGRAEDERWHRRKDGAHLWASGLMMRFDDEDSGEHVGFVKILRDRTQQHEAEQRLRDREEQLELALEAGQLGTWSLDLATMAFACDDACKAAFGRAPGDIFGYDQLLDIAFDEDREEVRAAIREAIDAVVPYDADVRIKAPDGSPRWVHVRGAVHRSSGGGDQMVGVTTDVTDRKRTEEALGRLALDLEHAVDERTAALVEANDKLLREINERRQAEETLRQAQKMEAVGQLTGGVAHDFNNLLTIIRGSIDLLARPDLPEERRARYVAAISDTVDRATRLTGQLLAFARRQPLKPQVFDLPARIGGVTGMLRSTVGAGVDVSIAVAPDVTTILADPDQFDTAMLNLTVNARDAMPEGGTLSIKARNAQGIPARRGHPATLGDFVAVCVADTGSGIDAELVERIFEPFFTTKDVGKGTGLGLSQVIGFAKQTGGDVVVDSAPGEGARFTLYLPRSAEAAAPALAPPAFEEEQPRGHGCILVVEDNAQVGEFATQMLHDLGYGTCWAHTAQAALDLLDADPDRFDAVFSDVVMPGMNGVELADRLRDTYPSLPVLLASGYSQVITDEGSHGFDLLHKPYSVDTLARALGRLLRESA